MLESPINDSLNVAELNLKNDSSDYNKPIVLTGSLK